MIKIYDLNNCPLSFKNGSYGGMAGDKGQAKSMVREQQEENDLLDERE